MSWGKQKDAGAWYKPVYSRAAVAVTAGGTGDATEADGGWIDRQGFDSLDAVIAFTTALAADQTLTIAANFQDADTIGGSGAADFGEAHAATVYATGDSGGSTETGVAQIGIDLTMARRYVRIQFTPNLSRANTDTANLQQTYILAGAKDVPANPARVNLRSDT